MERYASWGHGGLDFSHGSFRVVENDTKQGTGGESCFNQCFFNLLLVSSRDLLYLHDHYLPNQYLHEQLFHYMGLGDEAGHVGVLRVHTNDHLLYLWRYEKRSIYTFMSAPNFRYWLYSGGLGEDCGIGA